MSKLLTTLSHGLRRHSVSRPNAFALSRRFSVAKMELVDVYSDLNAIPFLYELLKQRDIETVSISHHAMPTVADHIEFYRSKPYRGWYIVMADGERVGSAYITHKEEIGIDIRKNDRRKGHGAWAAKEMIRRHPIPNRFLANINPKNTASLEMFRSIGFVDFQITLRHSVALTEKS